MSGIPWWCLTDGSKFILPWPKKDTAISPSILLLLSDGNKRNGWKPPSHAFSSKSQGYKLVLLAFLGPFPSSYPTLLLLPHGEALKKCFFSARASASPDIIYKQNRKEAKWLVKSTITAGTCLIWTRWLCPTSPQHLRQPGWLTAHQLIMQLVSGNRNLRKAQPFLEENNLLDSLISELVIILGPKILQRIWFLSETAATTRTHCVNNMQLHSQVKSQGIL